MVGSNLRPLRDWYDSLAQSDNRGHKPRWPLRWRQDQQTLALLRGVQKGSCVYRWADEECDRIASLPRGRARVAIFIAILKTMFVVCYVWAGQHCYAVSDDAPEECTRPRQMSVKSWLLVAPIISVKAHSVRYEVVPSLNTRRLFWLEKSTTHLRGAGPIRSTRPPDSRQTQLSSGPNPVVCGVAECSADLRSPRGSCQSSSPGPEQARFIRPCFSPTTTRLGSMARGNFHSRW